MPRHHPIFIGAIDAWTKRVEAATHGRIKIEYPATSLAPSQKQWQMVTSGIADIGIVFHGTERKRLQLEQMMQLPFLADDALEASVALWRTQKKFFAKADEYKGVKLLGMFGHSGTQIFNARHPITRIEDFKGLKIRVTAGVGTEIFKTLGAVPVPSTGPQIFEFVSKGIVDGIAASFSTLKSWNVGKYLPYGTMIGGSLGNVGWSVVMNLQKWNSLSAEDKAAIERVSGEEIARSAGRAYDADTSAAIAEVKKDGMSIIPESPELRDRLRARLAFVTDRWIKEAQKRGVDGRAALDYFIAEARSAGKTN
jgi:TRAP-type C4-dicarboxylate transport system substrate-binding protein